MALWLTAVLALTCLGGLAAPGPVGRAVSPPVALKELIEELSNITQDQRVSNTDTLPRREHEQAGSGPVPMTEEAPSPRGSKVKKRGS